MGLSEQQSRSQTQTHRHTRHAGFEWRAGCQLADALCSGSKEAHTLAAACAYATRSMTQAHWRAGASVRTWPNVQTPEAETTSSGKHASGSAHTMVRARPAALRQSPHTYTHTRKARERDTSKGRWHVSQQTQGDNAPNTTAATRPAHHMNHHVAPIPTSPYERSKQCLAQCCANPRAPDCGCRGGAAIQQKAAPSGSARPRVLHMLGVCPRNQTRPLSCLLHDAASKLLRPAIKHRPPMRLGVLIAPQ